MQGFGQLHGGAAVPLGRSVVCRSQVRGVRMLTPSKAAGLLLARDTSTGPHPSQLVMMICMARCSGKGDVGTTKQQRCNHSLHMRLLRKQRPTPLLLRCCFLPMRPTAAASSTSNKVVAYVYNIQLA